MSAARVPVARRGGASRWRGAARVANVMGIVRPSTRPPRRDRPMTHPYERYEGTPLWAAVERAVADLEMNDDVVLRAARSHVVGALCARLDAADLLRAPTTELALETRAGYAAYLDRLARGDDVPDEADEPGVLPGDPAVDEARRQAGFVRLRLRQGGIGAEQAAAYFHALARGLREREG